MSTAMGVGLAIGWVGVGVHEAYLRWVKPVIKKMERKKLEKQMVIDKQNAIINARATVAELKKTKPHLFKRDCL